MTDEQPRERAGRFTRGHAALGSPAPDPEIVQERFLDSLEAIDGFLKHAIDGGRERFSRTSPAYAAGCMVLIRTAALFETEEFAAYLSEVPPQVVAGIKVTRNIASHSGYRSMNDDVFWTTLTVHLPPYLAAWRRVATAEQ